MIHLRALKDFFEIGIQTPDNRDISNDKVKNDIYSEDYGFQKQEFNFELNIKKRLNREMAHLTYHRIKPPVYWKSQDTVDVIKPTIVKFIYHLKSNFPDVYNTSSKYYTNKWIDMEFQKYLGIIDYHILNVTPIQFRGATGPSFKQ